MEPFTAGLLGGAVGYALIATGAFFGGMIFRLREHYKAKKQGINYRAELARQAKIVDDEMQPKDGEAIVNPRRPNYSARICMDPKCFDDTPHPPHTNWVGQSR